MPEWRGNDSHDFNDMLNCSHKQHEIHAVSRVQIVVLVELCVADFLDIFSIREFAVHVGELSTRGVALRVQRWHEGRPEEWLDFNERIPIALEILLHDALDNVIEHELIVVIDQTILEHAHALVSPELYEVVIGFETAECRLRNPLEDFRDVTQVINVMRFRRGRQQFFRCPDRVVDFNR